MAGPAAESRKGFRSPADVAEKGEAGDQVLVGVMRAEVGERVDTERSKVSGGRELPFHVDVLGCVRMVRLWPSVYPGWSSASWLTTETSSPTLAVESVRASVEPSLASMSPSESAVDHAVDCRCGWEGGRCQAILARGGRTGTPPAWRMATT